MAQYAYLTASRQLKLSPGKVKGVVFSSGTNPAVALYDNVLGDTSNVMVDTMTVSSPPLNIAFGGGGDGISFAQGLYVAVSGTNPKVTIIFE